MSIDHKQAARTILLILSGMAVCASLIWVAVPETLIVVLFVSVASLHVERQRSLVRLLG